MWLAAASILSVFDISKAKDENGRDIEAQLKPMYGVVMYVSFKFLSSEVTHLIFDSEWEPFKCAITPRSKEAVERIRAATA